VFGGENVPVEVWQEVASVEAFQNVFGTCNKPPMIYNLILLNLGRNDMVETNRNKKGIADTIGDVNEEEFLAQPPLFSVEEEEEEVDEDMMDFSQEDVVVVEDEEEDDSVAENFI